MDAATDRPSKQLPRAIRDALVAAANSGGTLEERNKLIDHIMVRARRTHPHLFKAD